ncbi:MAG: hypothetical protein ACYSYL_21910 [Planctomycetota bacterium]|jgi:hypothetical protein
MNEEEKKEKRDKLLIVLDVFFITIITLGLGFFAIQTEMFWYVERFFFSLIDGYVSLIIPQWLVFIVVLVFDVSWIVLMVKWKSLKNIHIKILITWPVIVMSTLVLYALIGLAVLHSISDAFH